MVMRVYSIQSKDFVDASRANGYFALDRQRLSFQDDELPEFDHCYRWMEARYREHTGILTDSPLLWVWDKRPDLRRSAHGNRGDEMVLLTLDIPEDRILFSYFHLYSHMLNSVGFELWRLKTGRPRQDGDLSLDEIDDYHHRMFSIEGLRSWLGDEDLDEEILLRQGVVADVDYSMVVAERPFIAK